MNPEKTTNKPGEPKQAAGGILPREAEQKLKADAGAVVETAKSEVSAITEEAEHEVGALAEQGKAEIGKAIDKAKGLAMEQKQLFAEQLEGVSSAVQKVAAELEAEDASTAGYARTIADGVDRFTKTIKEKDIDGLVAMAEDFGRKQPGAFMAAAAIAGFAASRFLVASAKRRQPAGQAQGQYGGTGVGDGGVSGNYRPARNGGSTSSNLDRDTMGGI